jgi:surface protein
VVAETNFDNELKKYFGEDGYELEYFEDENFFQVTVKKSGRAYEIDNNGNITYLGLKTELELNIQISADPESNSEEKLFHIVELKVKTALPVKLENTRLSYAWKMIDETEVEQEPESNEYIEATSLTGTTKEKNVTIFSDKTVGGQYNLWVKVEVNGISKIECFGPYKIKDHTTLVSTASETSGDSYFLGMQIERKYIKKIIISNIKNHTPDNRFYFDVSDGEKGAYIGSYDKDDKDYYTVTLEGNGGIVANSNSTYLFANIGSAVEGIDVEILGFNNLDTGLVVSMKSMFSGAQLKELDLSTWNTENVTSLWGTFQNCTKLQAINVSNWNTSNVTEMGARGAWSDGGMFQNCKSLISLNLSSFNTNNVIGMGNMFRGCDGLTSLDLSNFDTSKVEIMYSMFSGCSSLTSLDVNKFDTINVKNMKYMFKKCSVLTSLDLSNFNTSKVIDMSYMFSECSVLTSLDLSNFDTSRVTDMTCMFYRCRGLTSLDVSEFNTSNVTSMQNMFLGCSSLTSLDVSNFNTENVINMRFMFYACGGLTNLDLSNFNTSKVTQMKSMFACCGGLTSLDLSNFDTGNVDDMSYMFEKNCGLISLNLSSFNTINVRNMSYMFSECSGLTSLNLSSFNTSNVTNMFKMFYICSNLTTIYVSPYSSETQKGWTIVSVDTSGNMFTGNSELTGGKGTTYNSSYTDSTYARIDEEGNPGYFTNINDKKISE